MFTRTFLYLWRELAVKTSWKTAFFFSSSVETNTLVQLLRNIGGRLEKWHEVVIYVWERREKKNVQNKEFKSNRGRSPPDVGGPRVGTWNIEIREQHSSGLWLDWGEATQSTWRDNVKRIARIPLPSLSLGRLEGGSVALRLSVSTGPQKREKIGVWLSTGLSWVLCFGFRLASWGFP